MNSKIGKKRITHIIIVALQMVITTMLILLQKMDEFSIFKYNSEYELVETITYFRMNILFNIVCSIIFLILLIRPSKKLLKQMRYWNVYLAIILSVRINFFVLTLDIQTSALSWGYLSNHTPALIAINPSYFSFFYLVLGLYVLQVMFLQLLSAEYNDNYNEIASYTYAVVDKLILITFILGTVNPNSILKNLFSRDTSSTDWLYNKAIIITLSFLALIILGILSLRLDFEKILKLTQFRKFLLKELVFFLLILSMPFLFMLEINNDNYYNSELGLHYSDLSLLAAIILLFTLVGFGVIINSVFTYFKGKQLSHYLIQKTLSTIKLYFVVIGLIGIISIHSTLVSENILLESTHEHSYWLIENMDNKGSKVDVKLFFSSNDWFFNEITNEYNITFSTILLFDSDSTGFELISVHNITSVTSDSMITSTNTNYTLAFNHTKVYYLELSFAEIIPEDYYLALGFENEDDPSKNDIIAAFPEMIMIEN